MPYTILDSFSRFHSNLEVTDLQSSTLSARQQAVRNVIDKGLRVEADFVTGSYARSTMISPLSEADIDIFVCLHPSYHTHFSQPHNGGPIALLNLARNTLKQTYNSTPNISRNGQAVTIRFSDFVIDVVLGFNRFGGGYLIANSVGNFWLSTDPKKHVEIFSQANKQHGGSFVPLIKMIKSWNKAHGSFFRSFHLELLALEILGNVRITDYPSGLRYFFQNAMSRVRSPSYDPAGYGDNIARYLTSANMDEAVRRFQGAFNSAVAAEQYAQRGQIPQSASGGAHTRLHEGASLRRRGLGHARSALRHSDRDHICNHQPRSIRPGIEGHMVGWLGRRVPIGHRHRPYNAHDRSQTQRERKRSLYRGQRVRPAEQRCPHVLVHRMLGRRGDRRAAHSQAERACGPKGQA